MIARRSSPPLQEPGEAASTLRAVALSEVRSNGLRGVQRALRGQALAEEQLCAQASSMIATAREASWWS